MVHDVDASNHSNAYRSISMIIYLYVKQHSITGLKYFGMTRKNPFTYLGSGKYWLRHLKKHGDSIKTLDVWSFDNQEECTSFALKFSSENNITESNSWANLQPENGIDGNPIGNIITEQTRAKMRDAKLGNANSFYGKKHTNETREHLSKVRKGRRGRPHTEASKAKIGEASRKHMTGRKLSDETRLKMSLAAKRRCMAKVHGTAPRSSVLETDASL